MAPIRFQLNGKTAQVNVEPEMPLLWVLRDNLQLTGTKYGCGVGVCGACTVHENGTAVRACQVTAQQASGKSYTTIEGLSPDGSHPCQRAWMEEDVAQCGFCQAGMIMSAAALLRKNLHPTEEQISEVLSDHVCRCGTYNRIKRAVLRAIAEVRA
jgi:aerobic-type carbon monoxide dehydrogenase small subunit (CoxS/CutS family)